MTRFPDTLEALLASAAPSGIEFRGERDAYGVLYAWCGLKDPSELTSVGEALKAIDTRLSMISAAQPPAPEEEEEEEEEVEEGAEPAEKPEKLPPTTFGGTPIDGTSYDIAYHFDLGGDTLTVIVYLPQGGSVPSLTALFRTADWHEREMMENYNIQVDNHPNPRRLFLDEKIDQGVLEKLIPYSTLVNAASTKGLWDKILAGKAGA
jgi:NADH:ubiquinone oxidoreductase subunit C